MKNTFGDGRFARKCLISGCSGEHLLPVHNNLQVDKSTLWQTLSKGCFEHVWSAQQFPLLVLIWKRVRCRFVFRRSPSTCITHLQRNVCSLLLLLFIKTLNNGLFAATRYELERNSGRYQQIEFLYIVVQVRRLFCINKTHFMQHVQRLHVKNTWFYLDSLFSGWFSCFNLSPEDMLNRIKYSWMLNRWCRSLNLMTCNELPVESIFWYYCWNYWWPSAAFIIFHSVSDFIEMIWTRFAKVIEQSAT